MRFQVAETSIRKMTENRKCLIPSSKIVHDIGSVFAHCTEAKSWSDFPKFRYRNSFFAAY